MKRLMVMVALSVSLGSCGNFGCSNDEPSEGGFGKSVKPSDEEKALFSEVAGKELSTVLIPFKVSQQVVAGTNYRFTCKDNRKKNIDVVIWQPLPGNGEAQLLSVSFGGDLSVYRLRYDSATQEQECRVSVDMPQGDSPLERSIRETIISEISQYASFCMEDRAVRLDIPEETNAVIDYFGDMWPGDMTQEYRSIQESFQKDWQMPPFSFCAGECSHT